MIYQFFFIKIGKYRKENLGPEFRMTREGDSHAANFRNSENKQKKMICHCFPIYQW